MINMVGDESFQVRHDSDTDEFTVLFGWCHMAGIEFNTEIEGVGETLPEALRDLADQLADRFSFEEGVLAG